MKGYSLVSEDKNSYQLKHPDGTSFKVAKSGIQDALHAKIKALNPVKMADGGEVADEGGESEDNTNYAPSDLTDAEQNVPESPSAPVQGGEEEAESEPAKAEVFGPPSPDQPQAGVSAADESVKSSPSQQSSLQDILKQNKQAYTDIGQAQQKYAKESADVYRNLVNKNATDQIAEQEEDATIKQGLDQLGEDVRKGKIDPNRLWSKMSTGSKISAGLGMILSGLGSGLTGQQNMAMAVINKAIDHDIDAQEKDLSNKKSLYAMNMQRYHDTRAARAATKLQYAEAAKNQILMEAAKMNSATAMPQAKLLAGQVDMQTAQLRMDLARQQNDLKSKGYGQGQGEGAEDGGFELGKEPASLLSDPKYMETRVQVPSKGRAYRTATKEGAVKMNEFEPIAGGAADLVNQLDALQKQNPRAILIPGTDANLKAIAIRGMLHTKIPQLRSVEINGKRVNETEAVAADKTITDPTKFMEMLSHGVKNNVFLKNLTDDVEGQRSQYYIGYKKPFEVQEHAAKGKAK